MMNSKVRIVPVAAACDRRRTDPKIPAECWSAGILGRWSNLATRLSAVASAKVDHPSQTVHYVHQVHIQIRQPIQAQSSLIKVFRTSTVKASQSWSKCFPIVTLRPQFQPPSRYIVVSPAKCTTHCGFLLLHTPMPPCNPQFPSNPDGSVPSDRSDRSDRSERFPQSAIRNCSQTPSNLF
jgi:hypothetical protein